MLSGISQQQQAQGWGVRPAGSARPLQLVMQGSGEGGTASSVNKGSFQSQQLNSNGSQTSSASNAPQPHRQIVPNFSQSSDGRMLGLPAAGLYIPASERSLGPHSSLGVKQGNSQQQPHQMQMASQGSVIAQSLPQMIQSPGGLHHQLHFPAASNEHSLGSSPSAFHYGPHTSSSASLQLLGGRAVPPPQQQQHGESPFSSAAPNGPLPSIPGGRMWSANASSGNSEALQSSLMQGMEMSSAAPALSDSIWSAGGTPSLHAFSASVSKHVGNPGGGLRQQQQEQQQLMMMARAGGVASHGIELGWDPLLENGREKMQLMFTSGAAAEAFGASFQHRTAGGSFGSTGVNEPGVSLGLLSSWSSSSIPIMSSTSGSAPPYSTPEWGMRSNPFSAANGGPNVPIAGNGSGASMTSTIQAIDWSMSGARGLWGMTSGIAELNVGGGNAQEREGTEGIATYDLWGGSSMRSDLAIRPSTMRVQAESAGNGSEWTTPFAGKDFSSLLQTSVPSTSL